MKLFLDTAVTDGNQTTLSISGLIDGVTTNPTLMMKSGRKPDEVYAELKAMGLPGHQYGGYGHGRGDV